MLFFVLILLLIIVLTIVNYKLLKYVFILGFNYFVLILMNYFLFTQKLNLHAFRLFLIIVLSSIIMVNILKKIQFFNEGLYKYKSFRMLKNSIFILKKNLVVFREGKNIKFADRFSMLFSNSLNEFLKYSEGENYGR